MKAATAPPGTGYTTDRFNRKSRVVPKWLIPLSGILAAAGAAAFLALASTNPAGAWQIFLVNFLFWSGVAVAGVGVAAMFEAAKARWADAAKQMAYIFAAYLPFAFLLFLITWFGRETLFPWIRHPRTPIIAWLNSSTFYTREAAGLLALYGAALLLARRLRSSSQAKPVSGLHRGLAIGFLIFYAAIYSVFAWDFIMSLSPVWTSTLFGAFYFMGNLYIGLAVVIILAVCSVPRFGVSDSSEQRFAHNMGKLLFSFSLFWTYLFWSQYLVIWYGNLPRETGWVVERTARTPWNVLSLIVLAMNFGVPFVFLMSRANKRNAKLLFSVAVVVVIGMWLERFLLVTPALVAGADFHWSWQQPVITLGFLASFVLTYVVLLNRIAVRGSGPA